MMSLPLLIACEDILSRTITINPVAIAPTPERNPVRNIMTRFLSIQTIWFWIGAAYFAKSGTFVSDVAAIAERSKIQNIQLLGLWIRACEMPGRAWLLVRIIRHWSLATLFAC